MGAYRIADCRPHMYVGGYPPNHSDTVLELHQARQSGRVQSGSDCEASDRVSQPSESLAQLLVTDKLPIIVTP